MLEKLLLEFPDEEWYMESVSENPNISFEFIENHPEFNWSHQFMSLNPNLTLKYVLDHPEINWHWSYISKNPGITLDDIKSHPECGWWWNHIVQNPNVTLDFMLEYVKSHHSYVDEFKYSGGTEKITLNDILECQKISTFLCKYKPAMSKNPNLTLDFVFNQFPDDLDNEENKWSLSYVGESPMITLDDILRFDPKLLNCHEFMLGFSENPNVTWQMVKENPTYAWDFDFVAANPNITMEEVEEFYDELEDKANASTNPNITYDWIIKNLDKVDFELLSENQFMHHKNINPIIIRI